MEKALSKIGVNAEDIDSIFITHSHVDHIAGLRVFSKKYKPNIYLTEKIYNETKLNLENVNLFESDFSIDNLNITYDDEGENFTGFALNGKARLPYKSEVSDYDWDEGTSAYLYNHLRVDGCYDNEEDYNDVACEDAGYIEGGVPGEGIEYISDIYGYWTLTSFADGSLSAWLVGYDGYVSDDDVGRDDFYGARPVINLKI